MSAPTPEQLDEMERLEKAATPGPWEVLRDGDTPYCIRPANPPDPSRYAVVINCTDTDAEGPRENDAAFIVAARSAMAPLIAEARRVAGLRAEVERLRALLDDCDKLSTRERVARLVELFAPQAGRSEPYKG